jgi:hypothetical protein
MDSNNKLIVITKEEWDEIYKTVGSNFLQMEQEIMSAYGNKQLEMYNNILEFVYKMVGTIGIVAGFGFTSVSFVESIYTFYAAELMFFVAMCIGMYWVSRVYQEEYSSLQTSSTKLSKIFRKRAEILGKIVQNYGDTNTISTDQMNELSICDQELLTTFSQEREEQTLETPIPKMIILLSIGGVLLLASYVPSNDLINLNKLYYSVGKLLKK